MQLKQQEKVIHSNDGLLMKKHSILILQLYQILHLWLNGNVIDEVEEDDEEDDQHLMKK
jgi:hypothetical protein